MLEAALTRLRSWWRGEESPQHLLFGEPGERAARKHLQRQGLKFLTANFRTERGEIDLVMRDRDCLQYVYIGVTGQRSSREG
jgi:putative endonuclease